MMSVKEIISIFEGIENINERLEYLYTAVDSYPREERKSLVSSLMIYFIDNERDINEYKTMLLIASNFKNKAYHILERKLNKQLQK